MANDETIRTPSLDDPFNCTRKAHWTIKMPAAGGGSIVVKLDTSRFGRRFVPFSHMVKTARLQSGMTAEELSIALGKEKALISKIETDLAARKRHIGNDVILAISFGLQLDVLEAVHAYQSQVNADMRLVAYPDDPGPRGREYRLPLPGSDARIEQREAWAGVPLGAAPRRRTAAAPTMPLGGNPWHGGPPR